MLAKPCGDPGLEKAIDLHCILRLLAMPPMLAGLFADTSATVGEPCSSCYKKPQYTLVSDNDSQFSFEVGALLSATLSSIQVFYIYSLLWIRTSPRGADPDQTSGHVTTVLAGHYVNKPRGGGKVGEGNS